MARVQLAGKEIFYKDPISGVSLNAFNKDSTVAELPAEATVEVFDVNRKQHKTISNWSIILEDIKRGIIKFVDVPDELPQVETTNTPITKTDPAEALKRATEFLDGSLTVIKHRLSNIYKNDVLDAMLMVEKSKSSPRKTVLDAITKRKNHPKVAGPGLITSEPDVTVKLNVPSGV